MDHKAKQIETPPSPPHLAFDLWMLATPSALAVIADLSLDISNVPKVKPFLLRTVALNHVITLHTSLRKLGYDHTLLVVTLYMYVSLYPSQS